MRHLDTTHFMTDRYGYNKAFLKYGSTKSITAKAKILKYSIVVDKNNSDVFNGLQKANSSLKLHTVPLKAIEMS